MNQSIECTCSECTCQPENVKSWLDAHYQDQLEVKEQQMNIPEDDAMEYVISRNMHKLPRLDRPLSQMTVDLMRRWIRSQIVLERYERGLTGVAIKWGNVSWEPNFWLSQHWNWQEVSNIQNWKKEDYYGPENITWFMKELLRKRLTQKRDRKLWEFFPSFLYCRNEEKGRTTSRNLSTRVQ